MEKVKRARSLERTNSGDTLIRSLSQKMRTCLDLRVKLGRRLLLPRTLHGESRA